MLRNRRVIEEEEREELGLREKTWKGKRKWFWRECCVWEGKRKEANKEERVFTEDKEEEEEKSDLRVVRSSKA